MLRFVLRRRRQTLGDAGVSLIELVTSMTLMAILGLITARFFITVDSSSTASTDRAVNAHSAGDVTLAWTNYLRVADGPTAGSVSNRFEWLTNTDVLFYADINNRSVTGSGINTTSPPTMMWLRLDSKNVLIEEQFPSTAAVGTKPTTCRRLLANVTAPTLFAPADTLGVPIPMGPNPPAEDLGASEAPTPTAGCQNLPVTVPSHLSKPDANATANLTNIGSVVINFTVADTKNKHSIQFTSVAALPVLGGSL
jgi:hypothetical protein